MDCSQPTSLQLPASTAMPQGSCGSAWLRMAITAQRVQLLLALPVGSGGALVMLAGRGEMSEGL
jgi:hypothetical protein